MIKTKIKFRTMDRLLETQRKEKWREEEEIWGWGLGEHKNLRGRGTDAEKD